MTGRALHRGGPWLLLAALLLAGCGGGAPDRAPVPVPAPAPETGDPRPFALGFAAVPPRLTEAAYATVFARAEAAGEVILIQRAVPWAEVRAGATFAPETAATIAREGELIDRHGLEVMFAIDPWDPLSRGRLAGEAPGEGFADAAVVEAYLTYVDRVVEAYSPRWLALAVEIDGVLRARSEELAPFREAYGRAYERVKARSPQTQVFVTFQFEGLQALLPWAPAPAQQWGLLLRFLPQLDLLAVSSFPSFLYPFAADIPSGYFSRLATFGKPVALTPVGYATAPGRGGVTFGTPEGQQRFVERILAEADAQEWALVIWVAEQDPGFAQEPPYDLVNRMGLRDTGGALKPAWQVWQEQAQRPWVRPGAAAEVAPAGAEAPPAR